MNTSLRAGDKIRVWVLLKLNGVIIDEYPHLIETHVTNGWQSWFSREPKEAICGKRRRHRESWRQFNKGVENRLDQPEEPCAVCLSLNIMQELAE